MTLRIFLLTAIASSFLHADLPTFKSQLFKKGELIYSDDFDGELNKKHWMKRTKNWVIEDGKLIGAPAL